MNKQIISKLLSLVFVLVLASFFVLAQGRQELNTGQDNDNTVPGNVDAGNAEQEQNAPDNNSGQNMNQEENENMPDNAEQNGVLNQEQNKEQNQNQQRTQEQLQSGVANALTHVTNENARQVLERNMQKFEEQYQERLQRMESVEVTVDEETGAAEIKAKEQVRFLGFIKGKATNKFTVAEDGSMSENKPWYRFLYSEQKTT